MYDFIIIGAGPAGCFAASELAKAGYSVCIVEKTCRGYRKVCGDGLNSICTEILRMMDFPMENLLKAGAVPIHTTYLYHDDVFQQISMKQQHKEAYGLSRNLTDMLFQEYVTTSFEVPILYQTKITYINRKDGLFYIGDLKCKAVIIASGVSTSIYIDNIKLCQNFSSLPVGVSMIVEGKPNDENYFLFDYSSKYHGTYAWIFSIGKNQYNIGLWLKQDKKNIRNLFTSFYETRVRQWLGGNINVIEPLRGSYMGIGISNLKVINGIYVIGDAALTANSEDGEGISKAILSAKHTISSILQL